MRIAIDARPLHWPGIGRHIRELLGALSRLDRSNEYIVHLGTEEHRAATAGLPSNFHPKILSPEVHELRGQLLFPWHLRREGADVLHVPFSFSVPILYSGQLVITVHDLMVMVLPRLWPSRAFRLYYRIMTRIAVERASVILAVSERTRLDLVRFFPSAREKTRVAHNGVNPRFRPVTEEEIKSVRAKYGLEGKYLFSVGTLKRHKNLKRLVEAYREIPESLRRSCRLVLLVKTRLRTPEEFPELGEAVAGGEVRLLEDVAEEHLPALYSGAEVFMLPSLYEGFGLPLLEAMACGVPAIAANAGALAEVAGEAALLVDPYRVDALRDAIVRLLSDGRLRDTLRERGLHRAREFSWERTAEIVLQSYAECAVRRANR